jgi:hypothetical protein
MSADSNSVSPEKPLFGKPTVFLDIDGTLVKHQGTLEEMIYQFDCYPDYTPYPSDYILPGVVDKINEWYRNKYYIVLTSARPEDTRFMTERMLHKHGIKYHQLVMGLTNGIRYLINDSKPYVDGMIGTAHAITVKRDTGLGNIHI